MRTKLLLIAGLSFFSALIFSLLWFVPVAAPTNGGFILQPLPALVPFLIPAVILWPVRQTRFQDFFFKLLLPVAGILLSICVGIANFGAFNANPKPRTIILQFSSYELMLAAASGAHLYFLSVLRRGYKESSSGAVRYLLPKPYLAPFRVVEIVFIISVLTWPVYMYLAATDTIAIAAWVVRLKYYIFYIYLYCVGLVSARAMARLRVQNESEATVP